LLLIYWYFNGGFRDLISKTDAGGFNHNLDLYGGSSESSNNIKIYNYHYSYVTSQLFLNEVSGDSHRKLPNDDSKFLYLPGMTIAS